MADENTPSPEEENPSISTEEKQRLLKELKERLKQIEQLKKELGIREEKKPPGEKENEPPPPAFSFSRMREEVEELRVPPLELLEDKPLSKKKKTSDASA